MRLEMHVLLISAINWPIGPAGPIRVSDNLLDIIGRVKLMAPPKWEVALGLAQAKVRDENIRRRFPDRNHRHGLDGNHLLHHSGHPDQLFGCP